MRSKSILRQAFSRTKRVWSFPIIRQNTCCVPKIGPGLKNKNSLTVILHPISKNKTSLPLPPPPICTHLTFFGFFPQAHYCIASCKKTKSENHTISMVVYCTSRIIRSKKTDLGPFTKIITIQKTGLVLYFIALAHHVKVFVAGLSLLRPDLMDLLVNNVPFTAGKHN